VKNLSKIKFFFGNYTCTILSTLLLQAGVDFRWHFKCNTLTKDLSKWWWWRKVKFRGRFFGICVA